MSCLNLRLPPAKKAWQSFTSKLQSKLHNFHKSKTIKKPRNKYQLSTTGPPKPARPSIFFGRHNHNRRRLLKSSPAFPFKYSQKSTKRSHFQKKSVTPIYIDKLFRKQPAINGLVAKYPAGSMKNVKVVVDDQLAAAAGTTGAEREVGADDMWESLGFASPQMRGIDERAEQFILSFRADMEQQEMISRSL